MAVVIPPPENRAGMALPPPEKLDKDTADKVRKNEEKDWEGKHSYTSLRGFSYLTYLSNLDRNPSYTMVAIAASVKKIGQFWRNLAHR